MNNASGYIEAGDMFRSKNSGDMFCIQMVCRVYVVIKLMYSDSLKDVVLERSKFIEEHIKYDY